MKEDERFTKMQKYFYYSHKSCIFAENLKKRKNEDHSYDKGIEGNALVIPK